jgi:hypothetical protein
MWRKKVEKMTWQHSCCLTPLFDRRDQIHELQCLAVAHGKLSWVESMKSKVSAIPLHENIGPTRTYLLTVSTSNIGNE